MAAPPAVSVIIPTRNRPGRTVRAVESVLAQTYTDFELLVVDDGSTDDTPAALDGFGGRVIVIRREHCGVSAARNHGIRASRGGLIAFLDSDDYWLPDKLAVQTGFFDQAPSAMICQTEEIWRRNGRRVNPRARHQKPSGDIFLPSLQLCLVSPSAVMMRRELFDLVGFFDETLPACEDYDLWLRVAVDHPVHLLKEPLVIKTGGHADQLSRTTAGLDQYRVRALRRIIDSGRLTDERRRAAAAVLVRKARIYAQGCSRRGRETEARRYFDIAAEYALEKETPRGL